MEPLGNPWLYIYLPQRSSGEVYGSEINSLKTLASAPRSFYITESRPLAKLAKMISSYRLLAILGMFATSALAAPAADTVPAVSYPYEDTLVGGQFLKQNEGIPETFL